MVCALCRYGQGIVGHAAQLKRAVHVPDAYSDPRFNKLVDLYTGFKTTAVLCCPTFDAAGGLVAVIQAINPLHGGPFAERDILQLRCMQMPISIALLNARLHQSLRTAKHTSAYLVDVAVVVNSNPHDAGGAGGAHSLHRLLERVVPLASERFASERCSIWVADHTKGEVWSLITTGLPDRFSVPLGKGAAGECAQYGQAVHVRDATTDPRVIRLPHESGFQMRNCLCVPIIDRSARRASTPRTDAQLGVPNRRRRRPSEEDMEEAGGVVLGVVQLINKIGTAGADHFTQEDGEAPRRATPWLGRPPSLPAAPACLLCRVPPALAPPALTARASLSLSRLAR